MSDHPRMAEVHEMVERLVEAERAKGQMLIDLVDGTIDPEVAKPRLTRLIVEAHELLDSLLGMTEQESPENRRA